MELNLDKIDINEVEQLLSKIYHIKSYLGVVFVFEGKKINFLFDFYSQSYQLTDGPYCSNIPKTEWFYDMVCVAYQGYSPSREFKDLETLVSEIYSIIYVVVMPNFI